MPKLGPVKQPGDVKLGSVMKFLGITVILGGHNFEWIMSLAD